MFSTDSIIPRIAIQNKCSFFFFGAIHLPPAEEGEFLLYYVKIQSQTAIYLEMLRLLQS